MRNSRSLSVHISDCFDSDNQNIVHLIYIRLQVMKKYLKLRKHTFKTLTGFSSP